MDDVIHISLYLYMFDLIFFNKEEKYTYVLNSGFRDTVGNLGIFHLLYCERRNYEICT